MQPEQAQKEKLQKEQILKEQVQKEQILKEQAYQGTSQQAKDQQAKDQQATNQQAPNQARDRHGEAEQFQHAPSASAKPERPPLWTRSFIGLSIGFFLLFLNLQMLLSSFPAYVRNEFQADDLHVSLVTSVFAISAIAARFMTAALMKRLPHIGLLLAGLLLAALTTALYSLAGAYGSLLALRVGYGIGFGMASTVLPTLVSRIIPVRRMGEGIAYFGLSTSLAMSIGPSIGLNVMKHAGFATLTVYGLVAAALILPMLWLSRRSNHSRQAQQSLQPQQSNQSPQPQRPAGTSGQTGFNRKLLFPALLNTLLAITYSGLLSFLALFGDDVGIAQVGLFFLFNAVTIILVRPFSGRLFDKKGHSAVLIPAGLFVAASMLLLSHAHAMPMLIAAALMYGAGFGAIQPTIQAWMLRVSSPEQYGTANSMFYNTTDFGVAIGAILLGAISSATGYAVMYRYSAACMTLFVVLGVLQFAISAKRGSRPAGHRADSRDAAANGS